MALVHRIRSLDLPPGPYSNKLPILPKVLDLTVVLKAADIRSSTKPPSRLKAAVAVVDPRSANLLSPAPLAA